MAVCLIFVVLTTLSLTLSGSHWVSEHQPSRNPTRVKTPTSWSGVHMTAAGTKAAVNGTGFDICYPHSCPNYKTSRFALKEFPAGKWLEIRKKPFDPLDVKYTAELSNFAESTGISVAVPVVVKVDATADHLERYKHYIDRKTAIMAQLDQLQNNTESLTSYLLGPQALIIRAMALSKELEDELRTYVRGFNMTVFNYLHPQYQGNQLSPTARFDVPTNVNLSIIHDNGFTVLTRSFVAVKGITDCHSMALEFSSKMNLPFSTFYLANYLNMNYEIWLSPDPQVTIFG